jgi:hypothetical protein
MPQALLLLLLSLLCNAQQPNLPAINYQTQENEINPYIKLLGIGDANAVVIKTYNDETNHPAGSYLAILNDGEMYRYGVYTINSKTNIRKVKVPIEDKNKFLELINEAATLDAKQLNLTEVTSVNGIMSNISFTNYPDYHLELYMGDKSSKFNSLEAEGYINARVNGYKMRQKLVDLCKALDFSETITTSSIENVKTQDTLYIRFGKSEFEKKQEIAGGDVLYDIAMSGKKHIYLLKKKDSKPILFSSNFATQHKEEIIHYDFFLKYGSKASFLNFRTLYVIEDDDQKNATLAYPVTIQFIEQ